MRLVRSVVGFLHNFIIKIELNHHSNSDDNKEIEKSLMSAAENLQGTWSGCKVHFFLIVYKNYRPRHNDEFIECKLDQLFLDFFV